MNTKQKVYLLCGIAALFAVAYLYDKNNKVTTKKGFSTPVCPAGYVLVFRDFPPPRIYYCDKASNWD